MVLENLSKILIFFLFFVCIDTTSQMFNDNKGRVYFSLSSVKDLSINDVIIIDLPMNVNGRFIEASDSAIINFVNSQAKCIVIEIHIKLNSNERFNKRYSDGLKNSLIEHFNSLTTLTLDKNFKVISLGSSENLIILDKNNKFIEKENRLVLRVAN